HAQTLKRIRRRRGTRAAAVATEAERAGLVAYLPRRQALAEQAVIARRARDLVVREAEGPALGQRWLAHCDVDLEDDLLVASPGIERDHLCRGTDEAVLRSCSGVDNCRVRAVGQRPRARELQRRTRAR